MRKSGHVLTRQYASVAVKPWSRDQPVDQIDRGGLDGDLERPVREHGDDRGRLLDPHPGHRPALDQVEVETHGGLGLGGRPRELGVALAGVDIAQVEARALVEHGKVDPVSRRDVADVEIAAPLALAVEARRHLALGRDPDGADERRDRPADPVAEVERAVAGRPARARGVAEDLGRVALGELRPSGGLTERPAPGPDRDPGVAVDQDVLDAHDERVPARGALDPDRAADRVRERRDPVEPRPLGGDGEILRRPEVSRARVVGLDLECLAGLDPKKRLVPPVERVLPGLLTCDPLHGLDVLLATGPWCSKSPSGATQNTARLLLRIGSVAGLPERFGGARIQARSGEPGAARIDAGGGRRRLRPRA